MTIPHKHASDNGVSLDPPDPDENADIIAALGEPFAKYARALIAAGNAAKRLQAAQVSGNVNTIMDATLERERAITAVYELKHDAATQLLFMIRCAAELFPGALQIHLDPVFRRELDHTQQALVEAVVDIDDLKADAAGKVVRR